MKLRRALAAAAATAAILPATLVAAPGAYASDETQSPTPTSEPSETQSATPTDSPTPSETPSSPAPTETETETPSATPTTNQPTATDEPSSPAPTDSQSPSATPTATGKPTDGPSASPSATATATGSPTPAPCEDSDDYAEDPDLSTTLAGLPTKVVAGSGFHHLTFRVENTSKRTFHRVDLGVMAGTVHEEYIDGTGKFLTLQYKDPESGAWESISTDPDDDAHGYIGYTSVRPHETLNLELRLNVAKGAPEGFGYALSVGAFADEEGNCVYSTGDYYEFDVVKTTAELPGGGEAEVPDAKPQGNKGKKPLPLPKRPAVGKEIHPEGELAATGSDSNLPTIAMIGGVAMVAGAGAIYVVRRRKAGAPA
ncbi:LAETG motif-containing sortase-dependent surface protein [Streptomyces sp. 796.1]|uniref:LAETG motif-containing sortase-dependent surface protein n=1 Tax=Streptomyces sp. 796.1 TaxID=3163029 RepID=UPI0039C92056